MEITLEEFGNLVDKCLCRFNIPNNTTTFEVSFNHETKNVHFKCFAESRNFPITNDYIIYKNDDNTFTVQHKVTLFKTDLKFYKPF